MARLLSVANRRKHDRIQTGLTVRYGPSSPERVGMADSLSEGGMFINTNEVYKVGTRLLIKIEFPDGTVTHHGEVVWAIGVPEHLRGSMVCGMGIRFLFPDQTWSTYFRKWKRGGEPAV